MKAKFWDGKNQKEFLEYDPDLYIGCSGHRQKIPAKRRCKVAIHVNPWGTKLTPLFNVNINETEDAIKWTLNQKPDAVFGYGHQEDEKTYWSKWTNWVGIATAGDATIYYPDKQEVDYKIAFFGGRWGYKGNNIDKWLLPVIKKLNCVAIHGWGGWQGIKAYLGPLPKESSGRKFLSSAKVCPCVCEPHTTVYGIDIPERFFKVALCGSLPILDRIPGFNRYCDNYLMADSPNDYQEMIINFATKESFEEKRKIKIEKIRKEVLQKHTYHHRMKHLCEKIGFAKMAKKLEERIFQLI